MTSRVLIVDDHAAFRRLARTLLTAEGLDVAGEAATGRDAMLLIASVRPDAVLLDVALPDANGLVVCRRIRATWPRIRVVLCSVRRIEDYGAGYADSDAHGFVAKDEFSASHVAALLSPG